ncbi:DUF4258 domain-containing protein [candidate division KSB1 bacterium]|nr:DUF4258 domain-containing protein [candidate division KSB1 bacterium]
MKQKVLNKIRECIRTGFYEMTFHADDEMVDDDLDILDIEHSILTGQIVKIEKDVPRGTKYTIFGIGRNSNVLIGTVGRFTASGKYRIITAYAI